MHHLLEVLRSEEFNFHDNLLICLPPSPMRHMLQRISFVQDIKDALKEGTLGEKDIREFANSIASTDDDMAMAAVAVALEDMNTDYAHEYVNDLASLNVSGFTTSRYVAREIVRDVFSDHQEKEVPPTSSKHQEKKSS